MAKSQAYHYEKDGVNLDFSFKEDEKINENKKIFVELMTRATRDLNKELAE